MSGIQVSGSSAYHASRKDRLMVGRDVLAMKRPLAEKIPRQEFKLKSESKALEAQLGQYSRARQAVSGEDSAYTSARGSVSISGVKEGEEGARMATLKYKVGGETKELTFELTGDTRITWGKDGEPAIMQGAEALTKGVLKAEGTDEILIRMNADTVEGGSGATTVINLSESSATFVGGKAGLNLWGSYVNSTILGGEGENVFSGVFTDCNITGGNSGDKFSGYFVGTAVTGGEGNDTFSGSFLKDSSLRGEGGDDSFTGSFIKVKLSGGEGKNFYGYKEGLSPSAAKDEDLLQERLGQLTGFDRLPGDGGSAAATASSDASEGEEAPQAVSGEKARDGASNLHKHYREQFIDVTIEDDGDETELDGVFRNADVRLGKGRSTVQGMLYDSQVDGRNSEANTMNIAYASQSRLFGGKGDNAMHMVTAEYSSMSGGEGNNTFVMGVTNDDVSREKKFGADTWALADTDFFAPGETGRGGIPMPGTEPTSSGTSQGVLRYNVIDASQGAGSTVTIATGDETTSFVVERDEEKDEAEKAADLERGASGSVSREEQKQLVSSIADLESPQAPGFEQTEDGEDAVQVVMSGQERRTFGQSYGMRKPRPLRSMNTFSSTHYLLREA